MAENKNKNTHDRQKFSLGKTKRITMKCTRKKIVKRIQNNGNKMKKKQTVDKLF